MPPQSPTPQKKPSGGRPLKRRLMSSDSQLSSISSGSNSDASLVSDLKRQPRRPSKASTLGLMEQDSGKGDPFSDSPGFGAWSDLPRVRSPDSELEYLSHRSGGTSHAAENTKFLPRQHSHPTLPPVSQPLSASQGRTGRPAVISHESESDMFSGVTSNFSEKSSSSSNSSNQRFRRPQALTSQPRSPSPTRYEISTIRSPPIEEDAFSIRSGMTSPVSEKSKSSPKLRSWKPLVPVDQSRPASPARSETSAAGPPPSPSRARWEHLRQHVLPSTPSAASISRPSTPQQAMPAPRSQVPKPSRLARLGFRQVVEHVRDVTAVDENRKFANEVLKVCWQARFMEPAKASKASREPVLDSGASNLYMPFMSNSSLTNTHDSSSTLNQLSQKRPDLKRPQSLQSLALNNRQVPTVRYIHAMLLHYATPSADQPKVASLLPHESQLLSALLTPFTTRTEGTRADEERWFSIEAFEIAVKTWKAATNQLGIERCLWCCKAASMSPQQVRMRILASLSSLLLSHDRSIRINTPGIFLTLVQGLFSLLSSLAFLPADSPEATLVKELIGKIQSGASTEMIPEALEKEYQVAPSEEDDEQVVIQALVVTGIGRFLEHGAESSRRWVLRYSTTEYWPQPSVSFTPLLTAIHVHKICTFSRGVLNLLLSKSRDSSAVNLDAKAAYYILRTRMVPETEAINGPGAAETRGYIIRLILELLCVDDAQEIMDWATASIFHWCTEAPEWKLSFEQRLQQLIAENNWPVTLKILSALLKILPDEIRKLVVAFFLPSLNNQLVREPPTHPCLPLSELLDTVSQMHPQIFYKPLFACAASSKELTVQNYLAILTVISRFLPDFWARDAEMLSVAMMSDGANKPSGGSPTWGKARLGQSVLLVEIIGYVQALRNKEASMTNLEPAHATAVKFFNTLEARLGILLEAKEKNVLVPQSQRALFCVLFLETRLLTRSLKSTSWLSRVVSWLQQSETDREPDDVQNDKDTNEEHTSSVHNLELLYAAVQNDFRGSHKRRTTLILSPSLDASFRARIECIADIVESFAQKMEFLLSLRSGFVPKILNLLVALSGMLSQDDYRRIGPVLWRQCLDSRRSQALAPACFLTMQCAEKTTSNFLKLIEDDIQSSDSSVRLHTVQKISTLFNWRFQLLSQHIVMDRNHRRPFKLARGPLAFIATDIGSSSFVLEEDSSQSKNSLPLELRKRLAEIGWAEDDEVVDQKLEWVQTPMSLLPSHELDLLDDGFEIPMSPSSPLASPGGSPMTAPPSPGGNDTDLLRRKSSGSKHSHGVKRRAVFVPALSAIFPQMASLVYDTNFAVANGARDVILDLMRNDPAILTRPVFDLLADEKRDLTVAITAMRAFEHVRRFLPPAMAYYVFNHLAGFLKHTAKMETPEVLSGFANVVPMLAKLVTQVSDMSIREIRRAKVEVFLIPSGALWFPSSAPAGPMFPRMLGPYDNPFEAVPSHLIHMTMIRLSQNMLFLSMLKRNPQDVQMIRKNMSRLVLPSRENIVDARPLKLADFVPHKQESKRSAPFSTDPSLRGLSLMLSRSYLLLIAQIFRSMSRHLNDRNELAVLIDGLNRILLVHGDDIGIVGHSMIALMVASTRFRRLFTSGGGYTLFMPVLIKVYAESESHPGIKLAIEYAVNRFYALHQEAFVYQSLDIIAHVVMTPDIEGDWLAKSVYTLFNTLRRGISSAIPDAAGIHDSNKVQEREALIMRTAEDKPQTFLASLRRGGNQGKDTVLVGLPEEYEAKRLGLDNFVRLFLTVIAHDPTILRAEHFMHFLRFLTPYLYNDSSSARSVLRDGIDALGVVLTKAAPKSKVAETSMANPISDFNFEVYSQEAVLENQLLGQSKTPSDIVAMRLDYLSTVVAFTRAGGQLGSSASQRTIDLIKLMLKDSVLENKARIASFFSEYTKAFLVREPAPSLKVVVAFLSHLAPVVSTYATTIDFSGVFDTVSQLAADVLYVNEPTFSRLVATQFCAAGIGACVFAASEKVLFSIPSRTSIIRLVSGAILLRGADVIAELEKHAPSYDFLVGVVLPLVLTVKTTGDVTSDGHWADISRRDVHARTWIRLLTYVMSACQKREKEAPGDGPERVKLQTQDKRRSAPSSKAQMMTLVAAIQIIKAIIIRAEDDLSAYLPGIWSRIASFFKTLLADGDAKFALASQDISVPPSPAQSPRASAASFSPHLLYDPTMPSSISGDVRSSAHVPLANPRVVDYCLWSLFELLSLCRSPLVIQMRLFLQEKVAILDQELHYHQDPSRPRSRRASSGIFSKPRRRMSGYFSGVPSPENSPTLSASPSFPSDPSLFHLDPSRQPGYQRFPSSPGGLQGSSSGPQIVHLGPVHALSASTFRRSLSPISGGVRLNKTAIIKSMPLVLATYRRIRLVQTCMGYGTLLPLPNLEGGVDFDDPATAKAWSKKEAMDAMVKEMKELMVEFEEPWREVEDDVVLIDADQSVTF